MSGPCERSRCVIPYLLIAPKLYCCADVLTGSSVQLVSYVNTKQV